MAACIIKFSFFKMGELTEESIRLFQAPVYSLNLIQLIWLNIHCLSYSTAVNLILLLIKFKI